MRSNNTSKGKVRDTRGIAHVYQKSNHRRAIEYGSVYPSLVYGVIPFYGQPMTSEHLLRPQQSVY